MFIPFKHIVQLHCVFFLWIALKYFYIYKKNFMKKSLTLAFVLSCCLSFAQNITRENLKEKLTHKMYNENALTDFHNSMSHLEGTPDIYEFLPGEFIGWSYMDGRFLLYKMFVLKNKQLTEVNLIPNDMDFLEKLNSYVPQKSRFVYSIGSWTLPAVKEKLKDNSYVIRVNVTSYNSRPYEPSDDILTYNIEYSTKDFISFRLLRVKDSQATDWIEIEEY